MKLLVYGIVRSGSPVWNALLTGVEGEDVSFVPTEDLAAGFSIHADMCTTPTMEMVMAYARVVASLHEVCAVIPMRYGCFLDSEAQILEVLKKRGPGFRATLDKLDGCVEVGLRVWLHGTKGSSAKRPRLPADRFGPPAAALSGTAYLAHRKAYYGEKDSGLEEVSATIEGIRQALDGILMDWKAERPSASDGRMLSLCLLIRREELGLVRSSIVRLQEESPNKVLVTGPWPPYNFVSLTAEDAE